MKYLYIGFLFISFNTFATEDCPYSNDDKPSLLSENTKMVTLPYRVLQYLNSGQTQEAKQLLGNDISASIIALDILLSEKGCSYPEIEIEKAKELLKTLALMNDKYPVSDWEGNSKVQSILQNYLNYESAPKSMVTFTHNK